VKIQQFIETNEGLRRAEKCDLILFKFEIKAQTMLKLSNNIMKFEFKIDLITGFKKTIETLIYLN
jgi:hypothetical protein